MSPRCNAEILGKGLPTLSHLLVNLFFKVSEKMAGEGVPLDRYEFSDYAPVTTALIEP